MNMSHEWVALACTMSGFVLGVVCMVAWQALLHARTLMRDQSMARAVTVRSRIPRRLLRQDTTSVERDATPTRSERVIPIERGRRS